MILTRSQVSLIANRVRELPDAVLAEIGFERVIGVAERPVPVAPVTPVESTPSVLLTEQRFDGERRQRLVQVVRRRKPEPQTAEPKRMTPAERVQAVIGYVRSNPGAQAGQIMKGLGWKRGVFQIAMGTARDIGAIELRGEKRGAAYYPKAERSAA